MVDAALPPPSHELPRSLDVQRFIETMMTLHISHLPASTVSELAGLAGNPQSPVVVYAHKKEGWLIAVPEQAELVVDTQLQRLPEEFIDLLRFARLHGCSWLLLDVDGDIYSMLPTWD